MPKQAWSTVFLLLTMLVMNGFINPYIEGVSFFVLVYFCVKMHKVAKTKLLTLVAKDNDRLRT